MAINELAGHTRRARTALWCALQVSNRDAPKLVANLSLTAMQKELLKGVDCKDGKRELTGNVTGKEASGNSTGCDKDAANGAAEATSVSSTATGDTNNNSLLKDRGIGKQ